MKKIVFALALLLIAFTLRIETQSTASYGFLVTSLSTTSTGAVNGTSFALPQGFATIVTWTVVADGSALSVNLEGSADNSVWSVIDSQTTATGGIRNYGFTSIKFVRISAVSRTGGTITTGTIITSRGFTSSVGGSSSFSSGTFLADVGSPTAPAYSFSVNPDTGFHLGGGFNNQFRMGIDGIITATFTPAGLNLIGILDTSQVSLTATTLAALGTPLDGAIKYCLDCLPNSVPCTGGSSGAKAFRVAAIWRCD